MENIEQYLNEFEELCKNILINEAINRGQRNGRTTKKWFPTVSNCIYNKEKGNYSFTISYIFAQDRPRIMEECNQLNKDVFVATRNLRDANSVILVISADKVNDFIGQYLNKVIDIIAASGNYEEKGINDLFDNIKFKLESIATSEDIEKSKTNITQNWKDLLAKMNDPETRAKMLMFQTSVAYERYYGSKLSKDNITDILSQNPNATFVTDAQTWKSKFNRTVNPNAQAIVITAPFNGSFSKEALDAAARKNGFKSYADAMKQTNNSSQTHHKIMNTANIDNDGSMGFYKKKVYDIADTTLISAEDPWLKLAGLVNNLTGEINDAATEIESAILAAQGKELPKPQRGVESNDELGEMKIAIMNFCEKKGINVIDQYDDGDTIAEGVYKYGLEKASDYNILRDGHKVSFAMLLTASICAAFNIQSKKAKQFYLPSNRSIEQDEVLSIYSEFKKISNVLNAAQNTKSKDKANSNSDIVAENIQGNILSLKDFENILHNLGVTIVDNNETIEEEEIIDDSFNNINESFFRLTDYNN